MNGRTLAEVLLRVAGVLQIVRGLIAIPGVLSQVLAKSEPAVDGVSLRYIAGWNLVQLFLMLIAGATLISLAEVIARRLVPREGGGTTIERQQVARVGFGVLGAYLLIGGLRDIATLGFHLRARPEYEGTLKFLWENTPSDLFGAFVQSVGGGALLLCRAGFETLGRKMRGSEEPDSPSAV